MAGARVPQAHRAQRAVADGIRPAARHDLDGHAALVDGHGRVEVVKRGALGVDEGIIKGLVLLLIEGAVEVVGLAPAIAGRGKDALHVQAFRRDDGGHGIVKAQPVAAGQGRDGLPQFAVGQRAGGDEDGPVLGQGGDFLPVHRDAGMVFHHLGDGLRELVPVHRQGAARRHPGGLGSVQQMGAHGPHLQFEQAGSRVGTLRLEGVGADQLGKAGAFMGRGKTGGLLLVQIHGHAAVRQPESGLAAGQAGAQNIDLHRGSFPMPGRYFFSTGFSKPQPSLAQ